MSRAPNPAFDDVLVAAKSGDGIAFEQLYRMLNRRVASFAKARQAADPDGVVNDVFLRVFQNLPTFEGNEDQFIGWVFQIARNQLIDGTRRRQRRPNELLLSEHPDEPTSNSIDDTALVDDTVIAQMSADRLLERLDCLTEEQRDVVLLRVVADQSLEVVAASMDKSVGAIKGLQRRALRTLAREIQDSLPKAVSR